MTHAHTRAYALMHARLMHARNKHKRRDAHAHFVFTQTCTHACEPHSLTHKQIHMISTQTYIHIHRTEILEGPPEGLVESPGGGGIWQIPRLTSGEIQGYWVGIGPRFRTYHT